MLIIYKDNPIICSRHAQDDLKFTNKKISHKTIINIEICSMASTSLTYRAIMRFCYKV